MKIECCRVCARQTDGLTIAFLELLSEPKNVFDEEKDHLDTEEEGRVTENCFVLCIVFVLHLLEMPQVISYHCTVVQTNSKKLILLDKFKY